MRSINVCILRKNKKLVSIVVEMSKKNQSTVLYSDKSPMCFIGVSTRLSTAMSTLLSTGKPNDVVYR